MIITIDVERNDTEYMCTSHIPETDELREALGWLWPLFVTVGCSTCIILYALFLEHTFSAIQKAHFVFRNSLIWISSIYPFMTLMTIIGFVIPKAYEICYTVKSLYLMIGMSKFTDLTLLMYGSDEVMLWTIQDSELKLNHGPVCCCLPCLPSTQVTKKKLRYIIAGVQQLPFTQSFYLVMIMILQAANEVTIGSMDPQGTYFWLNWFSVCTSLLGVYCLNLLSKISYGHLTRYSYSKLSFFMEMLIMLTTLQDLVFNILANYEVFPCYPPISHYVYKNTIENCFYVGEMLLFGIYSYLIYRKIPFGMKNPTVVRLNSHGKMCPHREAYIPYMIDSSSSDGPTYPSPGTNVLDNTSPFGGDIEEIEDPATTDNNAYDFSGTTLFIGGDSPPINSEGYASFI